MNFLPRNRTPNYSGSLPTDFEIWATNDPKPISEIGGGDKVANLRYWTSWEVINGTEEWKNDWVKIGDCHLRVASGASKYTANMALTAEDIDKYLNIGYEYGPDYY